MNLTAKEKQGESFNILVYNTHGLPEIFISDNPKMRFPVIGNKTKNYSISLLQEDYAHHEELSSCLLYTSPSSRDQRGSRMPSST